MNMFLGSVQWQVKSQSTSQIIPWHGRNKTRPIMNAIINSKFGHLSISVDVQHSHVESQNKQNRRKRNRDGVKDDLSSYNSFTIQPGCVLLAMCAWLCVDICSCGLLGVSMCVCGWMGVGMCGCV